MSVAKPKFLYDNRLDDADPVASSTASGYSVFNIRDWRPYTSWRPASMPATVTVQSPYMQPADYAFVYGHDLHARQVAIEIRGSSDNFVSNDVLIATSNLLAYPQEFQNAAWTKAGCTIAPNAVRAPDKTISADFIVENTANGEHHTYQYVPKSSAAQLFTLSAFFKKRDRRYMFLGSSDNTMNCQRSVDLDNSIISTLYDPTSAGGDMGIIALDDGWFWAWSSFTTQADSFLYTRVGLINAAGNSASYTGDGTSANLQWGAQLNFGAVAAYQGIGNAPLLLVFPETAQTYWRARFFNLSGSLVPTIAIVSIGKALEADVYLSAGFDPRGRDLIGAVNRSSKGNPLGTVIDFESYERTLEFEDVSWDWLRNSFEPAWAAHLRAKPFAFAWDPTDHANEVVLLNATKGYDVPHRAGGRCTLRVPVQGIAT
jgi:hypothetical protein